MLVISATAVLTSALTALGTNVIQYTKGDQAVENVYHINVQTSQTGTGAGANSSTLYDYGKEMGYTPLTATGGEIKPEYALGQWAYQEAYTGAIIALYIDVETAPTSNATFVDVSVQSVDTTTSSGNLLADNIALTVGGHQKIVLGSGSFLIGPDQQVVIHSSFGTAASLVADWNLTYRETELD